MALLSQTDGGALARILEDFNQMYPEVQVETLFVAYNDLLQSYAQAVADGSGPGPRPRAQLVAVGSDYARRCPAAR